MAELTPDQIAQMAEDTLRQICALEGIDFEAAKARRSLRNHKVSGRTVRGENANKY